MYALDIETSSKSGDLADGYALEPWRVRQGLGYISSIAIYSPERDQQILRPTADQLIELLESLRGQEVYGHFVMFDVAWIMASIEPNRLARIHSAVTGVRWRDTALLAKWVVNGRKAEDMRLSYSLLNLINVFKDKMGYPGAEDFIRMKQQEVHSAHDQYWEERGKLDVIWTYRLAEFLLSQLPQACRRGFVIEQRAIAQVANSWLIGMRVDKKALLAAEDQIERDIASGCEELGLPESVVSSPTQLGKIVFGDWGFEPISRTKTGKPSADADTWIILAHQTGDPRLKKLLKVRQSLTLRSKYIRTAHEALARTGDGYMYGKPQLFGTSSGRLTYSSETKSGMKVSIAQHQIPRKDKIIRNYLRPPEGVGVFETDAAAQESRIMGIWSGDPEIIRIFNTGINFHSFTASSIYGSAYEEFQHHYKLESAKDQGGQYTEWRQMGKLTNLSCNYRIGGKSLSKKALTEYDTYMSEIEGRKLVNLFKRTYSGIPDYWDNIIAFAKQHGYTYTLAQRRYKVPLDMLNSSDAWKVEGTIISHPIQGTGGDMFLAALSQVPEARMQTSLHDGIFWLVDSQEEADYILEKVNATPYADLWQMDSLSIPLLYEGTRIGESYADVK